MRCNGVWGYLVSVTIILSLIIIDLVFTRADIAHETTSARLKLCALKMDVSYVRGQTVDEETNFATIKRHFNF